MVNSTRGETVLNSNGMVQDPLDFIGTKRAYQLLDRPTQYYTTECKSVADIEFP